MSKTINVCNETSRVYLPYYLNRIECWATKNGNTACKVFGESHPDDRNRPLNSPTLYLGSGFFDESKGAQQMANLVMNRFRYYTMKIESVYEFNEIVRKCRPLREKYKPELSAISKRFKDEFGDYKTNGAIVAKLQQELKATIPDYAP